MVPLSVEDMTKQADAVVRGKVLRQQAAWDDKHQRIYTTTDLEVLEPIHNPAQVPHTIQVRSLGGEVDGIGMAVAGTTQFAVGEEVVLFLRKDPQVGSAFQVIGMNQGKFHIERESKGRVIAVPTLEGIALARPGVDGVIRPEEQSSAPPRIPLDDLRQKVVAIARTLPGAAQSVPSAAP
jgi:hypothetical protein